MAKDLVRVDGIIDSGCTIHCSGDAGLSAHLKAVPSDRLIQVADDRVLRIPSAGDIICNGPSWGTFVLQNVQYVPEMTKTLVSVSQLVDVRSGFPPIAVV